MTDLDLIAELRPDLPLATTGELAQARGRLTAGIAMEVNGSGGIRVPGALRRWRTGLLRPSRRLGLTGLGATAAAVGVAVALVLSSQAGPPSGAFNGPVRVNGQVAAFLDNAAIAVLHQPSIVPGPDQFIYMESVTRRHRANTQSWQSVTGRRSGLVNNGGNRYRIAPCSVAMAEAGKCGVAAGYLPDFPTQPGRVLGYLIKIGLASRPDQPGGGMGAQWIANDLGKTIDVLLLRTYLLPAQRAALYEFMARTPGFYPVPHAVDAVGRHGFGIAWNYLGAAAMIIFNLQTFGYLGDRSWPSPGSGGGNQYDGVALIKFAVVNHVGQT